MVFDDKVSEFVTGIQSFKSHIYLNYKKNYLDI